MFICIKVYGVNGCIGWIWRPCYSPGLHHHGHLHQTDEGNLYQTCDRRKRRQHGEGYFTFILEGKQYVSLLDETQEDQLNDGGGDNDPDHHHDCVRDLIDLDLHFPLPLAPHDQTHETQHQLSGSDLHWVGGDGRDHSETGEDQTTKTQRHR